MSFTVNRCDSNAFEPPLVFNEIENVDPPKLSSTAGHSRSLKSENSLEKRIRGERVNGQCPGIY